MSLSNYTTVAKSVPTYDSEVQDAYKILTSGFTESFLMNANNRCFQK